MTMIITLIITPPLWVDGGIVSPVSIDYQLGRSLRRERSLAHSTSKHSMYPHPDTRQPSASRTTFIRFRCERRVRRRKGSETKEGGSDQKHPT